MEGDPGGEGSLADFVDRHVPNDEAVGTVRLGGCAGLFEHDSESTWVGGAHQRCGLLELGQRALGDEPALVDDDDVVGEVFDFGEEMARHEHGAAIGGSGPEPIAKRPDAFGVEAVARVRRG